MTEAYQDEFIPAVAAADIQSQQVVLFEVGGLQLILTRLEGRVYAFSSECPHVFGDMLGSTISRKRRIDCQDHGYVFDIRSGRITWPEDENYCLRQFPVREVDGQVWVKVKLPLGGKNRGGVGA